MARWNKYVKKAFESLGYSTDDTDVRTKADIEYYLRMADETISSCTASIAELEQTIREAKAARENIQEIYDQIEIEEVKAMNPKAIQVYKL